jgi:hypothetical protein
MNPIMAVAAERHSHGRVTVTEALSKAAPRHAEGVEEDSRWSSASRHTRVVAKNEAARKPPDRIATTIASRQGLRMICFDPLS